MSEYPKWFHAYSKPYPPLKPIKPEEFILEEVSREDLGNCDYLDYTNIDISLLNNLEGNCQVVLSCGDSKHGTMEACLNLVFYDEVKNNNYSRQLKRYNKDLLVYKEAYAKYKERLGEWNEWKSKWDKEKADEKESTERKQYEILKKKFGDSDG